jgi:transcriptional regulator with XRE-family HTH domain
MSPLNWQLFIDEALRRRKIEKLTQKEHAALAGVSIPTMAAFERGDMTLSLAKAFDILQVVGLIAETKDEEVQDTFIRRAFARWQELSNQLPVNAPGRFPHGWYQFDYYLEGDLNPVSLEVFEKILVLANKSTYTGWPPFLVVTHRESIFRPEIVEENMFECWLASEKDGLTLPFNRDIATCDFWQADPNGRMFLIRGYQEDGAETFPAGSVFDNILPIWRMGEVFLHAAQLASLLQKSSKSSITLHFRAIYQGLSGRVLRSWSNPLNSILFEQGAAKSNEAVLQAVVPIEDIPIRLADHIYPMVASLYERFGIAQLSKAFVDRQIMELINRRSNNSLQT